MLVMTRRAGALGGFGLNPKARRVELTANHRVARRDEEGTLSPAT
jgi:hypothetical protein